MDFIYNYLLINNFLILPILIIGAILLVIGIVCFEQKDTIFGFLLLSPALILAIIVHNDMDKKHNKIWNHMEKISFIANSMKERFGCYPTTVNAIRSMDVFNTKYGNSCKKENIAQNEDLFVIYNNQVKTNNNHFLLEDITPNTRGEIIEKYGILSYKIKGIEPYNHYKIYNKCILYSNNTEISNKYDEDLLNENNKCGIDEENNPVVYIGKTF